MGELNVKAEAEIDLPQGYPRDSTLHDLVRACARSTPDKPAIVMGGEVLTYRQLERRSDNLAVVLSQLGVTRGDRVGLLSHRSPDAITAMLATVKLGGFFMPLDPSYPDERLQLMLQDARPKVVLAQAAVLATPPDLAAHGGAVRILEELARDDAEPAGLPSCDSAATDAAYIIYTSGSTGRPKGVLGTHRGVVRAVWRNQLAGFDHDAVTLHLTAPSFDPSQLEIWGGLVNGGTVAILPDPTPSLDLICEAIARHGATWTSLTTGIFHMMVDHRLEGLRPLKCVFAGGDVLSPAHANKAAAALPGVRIVNAYGPTENGIVTSWFQVPPEGWLDGAIPIGHAVPHTQVYILDDQLEPAPEGDVGELCAGGDGLAQGYFERPDLTAEKFIPDTFSREAGARLYRTGDLVRRRPDGLIEFVGRRDRQVKINNKRVELDEIENIVRRDERLADAIVILREDEPGAPRLTAYLKPQDGAGLDVAPAVLASLKAILPQHMVPVDMVVMPAFPLTEAGKVDRKALPRPSRPPVPNGNAPLTPSTSEIERAVLQAWRNVLKTDAIGLDDNFFDLGGTSMQLVSVHAELQKNVRADLKLVTLFDKVRIRDIAAYLAQGEAVKDSGMGLASQARQVARGNAIARARSLRAREGR